MADDPYSPLTWLKKGAGWLGATNAPQVGANPYQGEWNTLIEQLKRRGTDQSDLAHRNASDTAMQQARSMSSGGSAGSARQAAMSLAGSQAQLGAGYQQAKLAEHAQNQQSLQAALSGAGNAASQRDLANLQAKINAKSNFQKFMDFASQTAGISGMMSGRGGGGGGGTAARGWAAAPEGSSWGQASRYDDWS